MKGTDIKKRYEGLVSERQSTVEEVWDLIERYVVPFRGDFYRDLTSEHQVQWRRRKIYDSTAVNAAQTLSASIQGTMTSPALKWFSLRFRQPNLNKDKDAKEWLEICEERMYGALQESNFGTESAEGYLDLVTFGTAVIVEEDDEENDNALDFDAVPMREAYFEEDHRGHICKFFRKLQWTPKQMATKFGADALPQEIRQMYEGGNNSRQELIFCVFDRPAMAENDTFKMLPPDRRSYGYKYVLAKDGTELGKEGGYYEMPTYLIRWRKVAGSKWGHSPAMVALSDILTLNELVEVMLEAMGKVVDPATLTTTRGLLSDLDLGRAGLTVVRSLDDIKPYESGARFDVADMNVDRLQGAIQRAFYVDQLQLKESPAMTATEVSVRYELMQRLMGPTMGRLQDDFLNRLIERTFKIMWRAGRLPKPPQIVSDQNPEMDVEYTGPLPRSQKMETARQIQNWLASLGAMAEIFPEVRDIPDIDAIARGLADMEGVPAAFTRDQDTIDAERQERREKEAAANAIALAREGGEAAKAMGEGATQLAGSGAANG